MNKHISVMVKPASSLCNIRCSYCFYSNVCSLRDVISYGMMNKETVDLMIKQIYVDLDDGDELTIAFQGGEPTMVGLSYYRYLVDVINKQEKDVRVNYAIQTNGLLVNERWCEFFLENNFLVGLSIDGYPEYHNRYRLDAKQEGTFERVYRTKQLLDEYKVPYNVLTVLTELLAQYPDKVYDFIEKEDIKYIQFIPCLSDLDAKERDEWALTPESFARFYDRVFDIWLKDLESGVYRSIKLFDDIYNQLVNLEVTACGIDGMCRTQYIIEADGSVYPCDFYALDEWRMGYIQENTLKEMFTGINANRFRYSRRKLSDKCLSCQYVRLCCGGCKRMSKSMYVNKVGDFCGYELLLNKFLNNIDLVTSCLAKI